MLDSALNAVTVRTEEQNLLEISSCQCQSGIPARDCGSYESDWRDLAVVKVAGSRCVGGNFAKPVDLFSSLGAEGGMMD